MAAVSRGVGIYARARVGDAHAEPIDPATGEMHGRTDAEQRGDLPPHRDVVVAKVQMPTGSEMIGHPRWAGIPVEYRIHLRGTTVLVGGGGDEVPEVEESAKPCLLYTSDAADE